MGYKKLKKKIEKCIDKTSFPPKYEPKKWEKKSYNCYLYALDACADFRKEYSKYWIAPGFLSRGKKNDYRDTKKKVLQYFIEDCKILKLNVSKTSLEEKIAEDEYKIAVYVWKDEDYHFVRQDSNGNWSEKQGWGGEIETVNESEIRKRQLREYRYIGMFKISKKNRKSA